MRRKAKLVREQELFNVKLLDTETFDRCHAEFQHTRLVYSLYERLQSDIEKWSETPWQDVGIEFVREIFAALVLKFKRLPVSARDTRPARVLANYLKELRLSVPILLQLKNDALKPRHWREMLHAISEFFFFTISIPRVDTVRTHDNEYSQPLAIKPDVFRRFEHRKQLVVGGH